MKKTTIFSFLFLAASLTSQAFAGPFVDAGGAPATPSKYEVTIKSIEFRNKDTGNYVPYFSGESKLDIASVVPGGTGGFIGKNTAITPGTYDKMRVTVSTSFSMKGSASNVGPAVPAATCSTGGTGTDEISGYTVNIALLNGTTADQTLSVPPEVATDKVVKPAGVTFTSNAVQIVTDINITVPPKSTSLPDGLSVRFDVPGTLEFLNTGTTCYGLALPPIMTITTPDGSSYTFQVQLT